MKSGLKCSSGSISSAEKKKQIEIEISIERKTPQFGTNNGR
jgi:hypothetical protein